MGVFFYMIPKRPNQCYIDEVTASSMKAQDRTDGRTSATPKVQTDLTTECSKRPSKPTKKNKAATELIDFSPIPVELSQTLLA